MYGGINPHAEENQQEAIERVGGHSTQKCTLRLFARPFSAQQQQADEKAIDQQQHDGAVAALFGHRADDLRDSQPKDEPDLGIKDLQQGVDTREDGNGIKPRGAAP